MAEQKSLAIADIRIDGGTQPRVAISQETVRGYADYLEQGISLPPVDVFFDGVTYWLADGFHRYFAFKLLERSHVSASVHTGTKRDAVLFSVGANAGHGLQRTRADKRKAAMTLLQDNEWSQWSDREVARRCGGVDHTFIGDIRRSLVVTTSETNAKPDRAYTTKHGTESTMRVENIGKNSGPRVSQKAAFNERVAAAAEGVSPNVTKRFQRKSDADIVANAMNVLNGVNGALGGVDVARLADDPRAAAWCETAYTTISLLRAFNRHIERKSA